MKTSHIIHRASLACAALALCLSACTSAPNTPYTPPTPEQFAPALRATVATGATLALQKNPRYLPAAWALVMGIDAAVLGTGELTQENIATFVKEITTRHGVPAEDAPIFITLAQQIYLTYTATYKVQVVKTTDPRVLLFVTAFKDGLGDAITAVNSSKTPFERIDYSGSHTP